MVVLLDATIVPLNAISPSEVVHAMSLVTFAGEPNTQFTTRIVDRMDALLIVVGRVVSVEVM